MSFVGSLFRNREDRNDRCSVALLQAPGNVEEMLSAKQFEIARARDRKTRNGEPIRHRLGYRLLCSGLRKEALKDRRNVSWDR
jgi:hypothetical protein